MSKKISSKIFGDGFFTTDKLILTILLVLGAVFKGKANKFKSRSHV